MTPAAPGRSPRARTPARRGALRRACLAVLACAACAVLAAPVAAGSERSEAEDGGNKDASENVKVDHRWYLVPDSNLVLFEAFEYAMLRINELRTACPRAGGIRFRFAPMEPSAYRVREAKRQEHRLYWKFQLVFEPIHKLTKQLRDIHVNISKLNSVTDLSLFDVTGVHPSPCDLFSTIDDAEQKPLVPLGDEALLEIAEGARDMLNHQRQILCGQSPELQLIPTIAAHSVQFVEGKQVRLALELREAGSADTLTEIFTDVIAVTYALDQDVPGQCTISPEYYPTRDPCSMTYLDQEETAIGMADADSATTARRLRGLPMSTSPLGETLESAEDGAVSVRSATTLLNFRSLRDLRTAASTGFGWESLTVEPRRLQQRGRRLWQSLADAAPTGHDVEQRFVDRGLDMPDDYDPRLRRSACFPSGISRRQGSCGSSFAFASSAVAALRECLWKLHEGLPDASIDFLSAQELVSCDGQGDGCSGGSAASAFYYMHHEGIARESCSPYRMRCFNANSGIAKAAADSETSTPKSKHFEDAAKACPLHPHALQSPCKCLPNVFHVTKPIECDLLPNACNKTKLPHYFKIAGTAEGADLTELERHMMQELKSRGPLYVSIFIYEDFYTPTSWTESGIYISKDPNQIGKHAAALVGWGRDTNGRDYWLLMNSFGDGWQQEGYFKILRKETALHLYTFGAWGADWSHPDEDKMKPTIADVEVAFSPVVREVTTDTVPGAGRLVRVWLQVTAFTDEPARMLARVRGFEDSVTGEDKDADFVIEHTLRLNLLQIGLIGEHAEIQIWAVDRAQNTAMWGPMSVRVPTGAEFETSQPASIWEYE